MIRIVIVDDQELVRAGLRTLAESEGDIAVVGEAATGSDAVSLVRKERPDVALMDIRMPGLDGLEATRRIVADPELREVRVLMLTTFDEDEHISTALRHGAAGYLLKDIRPGDLRHAIRVVAAGEALLSPAVTRKVIASYTSVRTRPELLSALTERERDVLREIALGHSNTELAARLHISAATARTYVSRLLAKLAARDRAQLVVLGYESGLVSPGELSALA
ncbi:MAG: response regulator transcription factor [Hamadaea sp.]|uniref:response regulator n=1 Tax=Hamadaea sp. TaxID=2024425 RepID=UPI001841AB28|nr:response regulator transcription factor [Hamadaea sp.]NUR73774.1 response regulator transcription factor [Hamadaea sp.]NUT18199.1 response regulator transcription factor [Hamadaea sp.]